MFKLIKIINSGVNVPEPIRMPKASGKTVKSGTLLTVINGELSDCGATTTPTYVALADASAEAPEAICAAINGNMYFDAPITESPASLKIGAKVTLATDGDGAAYALSTTTSGGVATVIDLCGATSVGDKITVKF